MKNNLTIARGEGGGGSGGKGFQELLKMRHMGKTRGEGGSKGGKWVWLGWGGVVGRKCRQL